MLRKLYNIDFFLVSSIILIHQFHRSNHLLIQVGKQKKRNETKENIFSPMSVESFLYRLFGNNATRFKSRTPAIRKIAFENQNIGNYRANGTLDIFLDTIQEHGEEARTA